MNTEYVLFGVGIIAFIVTDWLCYRAAVTRYGSLVARFGMCMIFIPGSGIYAQIKLRPK